MLKTIAVILFFILPVEFTFSQDTAVAAGSSRDTLQPFVSKDSSYIKTRNQTVATFNKDSLLRDSTSIIINLAIAARGWQQDTAFTGLLRLSTMKYQGSAITVTGDHRKHDNEDNLFYIMAGMLLLLAFLKLNFPKYFYNIFSLSFQVKFRQTQTRDLLLQNRLPAFLFNIYFVLSAGLFITLLSRYFRWINIDFWWLLFYVTVILACIYLTKYLFIRFTGWMFKADEAAASYNFIVLLINKVLGIILVPITILFAFSDEGVRKVVLTIAGCVIFLLLAFRYVVSLLTVKRNLNISAFHFFLYLCAVEVMPMLVIYKALFLKASAKL